MNYYSNKLEDDFIEIDDTISNKEYHFNESKENRTNRIPFYNDWKKATAMHYDPLQQCCQSTRTTIDAQLYNAYRQDLMALANACRTQQIITNPINFIQQQLNTSCNNVENGLRNVYDAISKFMED